MKFDESFLRLIPAIPTKSEDLLPAMRAYHSLPETLKPMMLQLAGEQKDKLMDTALELSQKSERYNPANVDAQEFSRMSQDDRAVFYDISEEAHSDMTQILEADAEPLLEFLDWAHKYSADDFRTVQQRYETIKEKEQEEKQ